MGYPTSLTVHEPVKRKVRVNGRSEALLLCADRHQKRGNVVVTASLCHGERRTNPDFDCAYRNHATLSEAVVDDLFAPTDN